MRRRALRRLLGIALACSSIGAASPAAASEALDIGHRIWRNETGGDPSKLVWWNPGEAFPSLGIAHFIWYPAAYDGPFEESFPALMAYLDEREVPIPAWLRRARHCPWRSREELEAARGGERVRELEALLLATVAEQSEFLMRRLEQALPRMLRQVPAELRRPVSDRFRRLESLPHGRYALTDYVSFKGEGVKESERYRGEGWGLLQVLMTMRDAPRAELLDAFADAALLTLRRRVENSPPSRLEARWLPGWGRRIDTYRGVEAEKTNAQ